VQKQKSTACFADPLPAAAPKRQSRSPAESFMESKICRMGRLIDEWKARSAEEQMIQQNTRTGANVSALLSRDPLQVQACINCLL
jgi:hypothetical protein